MSGAGSRLGSARKLPAIRVGLISDTHGLLRPEACAFLRGAAHIVHAGDIGSAAILDALAALAPVTAVRGNNDHGPWADAIGETASLEIGGVRIHVVHDAAQLALDPKAAGLRVVVTGHSHRPAMFERDGVLHVNPGSAGPRRFKLPVSAAEMMIRGVEVEARTIDLLASATP
ncbi:MAG: metallophosphoesterase family protein [Proteobacteria bacterium]|nr:metallophosphoesterase family protein [Pseudomonadota bacterium]